MKKWFFLLSINKIIINAPIELLCSKNKDKRNLNNRKKTFSIIFLAINYSWYTLMVTWEMIFYYFGLENWKTSSYINSVEFQQHAHILFDSSLLSFTAMQTPIAILIYVIAFVQLPTSSYCGKFCDSIVLKQIWGVTMWNFILTWYVSFSITSFTKNPSDLKNK